ncbi:hypothetical protein TNCV_1822011 [Trichonephila clavipes]|nr:hypothetical protein TNCV_1822011 [Trichonephila clavipes]
MFTRIVRKGDRKKKKNDKVRTAEPFGMVQQEKKKWKHINSFQSLDNVIHWSPSSINVPAGEKWKHINSLQSLNDVIHWSVSTVNVPAGKMEREKHINYLQSLNDVIHWSPSTINVPAGKMETHQFSPILERCHPLESFNC